LPSNEDIWSVSPSLTFENEAAVETRLVLPLLRALGYSEAEHIYPKYPVVFQEGRRGRKPEADFVVFAERPHSRATSLITVEAKHPHEGLDDGKEQGESYAANIRTPILVMTNGLRLDVWQYQPTTESELILTCAIADLPAQRGKIEELLSREAVITYARTLRHKSFGVLAQDLGAYEQAEFERVDGIKFLVPRRLKDLGPSKGELTSEEALTQLSEGAVVLGASGYGKTTLAHGLGRQAIERRWSNESRMLPIEVFLPDAPPEPEAFEEFLRARVTAHCPQVSQFAFRDRLRNDGIVLLADGFDRIPSERRLQIEGVLVTFRRDYPKSQLFLFTRPSSRPERIALPSLEITELNDEEQYDLVERFSLAQGYSGPSLWYDVSGFLRTVCRHPLILQLTLSLYGEQGRLPTSIEPLFRSWLNRLIPATTPLPRRTDLRRLLTVIANATIPGPLLDEEVVRLIRSKQFQDELLEDLLSTDALTQRGATIELQHEALADYLRALDVVQCELSEVEERLRKLPMREGSYLPTLLMAMASSPEMQDLIWAQIATADIKAAMTALRYRADTTSSFNPADPVEVSRRYLSEVIAGIELPLDIHFRKLAPRIRFELVGEPTDRLGIAGVVSTDGSHVTYSFTVPVLGEEVVKVGGLENAKRIFGKSLSKMGLRLDSGRLVGMGHIREALLHLVKYRRLDGGLVWAEERTLSRVRHLAREYGYQCGPGNSLEEIRSLLIPDAGRWVEPDAYRAGQTFEINELLADIDLLLANGRTILQDWWIDLDGVDFRTSDGQERLSALLNTHYRRTQLTYREVVETSFPLLAEKFPLYQMMPLRYEIEIEFHNRGDYETHSLNWRWIPVGKPEDMGATVTFKSEPSDWHSNAAWDAYARRINEALARFNRAAPDRQYTSGSSTLSSFLAPFPDHNGQVDETSVLRSASKYIGDDLKRLFKELPSNDEGGGHFY